MTGSIDITMLGRFEVRVDGVALPASAWRRRQPSALVKLLALAPGRRLHREQVLDALWPDVDPVVAAPRLHKAAHYVRTAIGGRDSVELSGDVVALLPGADVRIDVVRVEALAVAGDVEGALASWGGELLPDDLYEPWVARDRDRLRLLRLRLLRSAGRWDDLLDLDPADEDAHVALMEMHLRAGRPGDALRQYARLRRALLEELGVEPGDAAETLRNAATRSRSSDRDSASAASGACRSEGSRRRHMRVRADHRPCRARV